MSNNIYRQTIFPILTLFTSVGTLLCCALPALLVTLGAGAALAGFISVVPWITAISKYKVVVFVVAGILLALSSYFFKYQNRYTDAEKIYDAFMQSVTFGLAPYQGDFGDLHTWLMFKIEHKPENKENLEVTPLFRFFKSVHMLELGLNDRGKFLFNYFIRF